MSTNQETKNITLDDVRKCKDAAAIAAVYGPLHDRTFFITGASSGFGLEMSLAIAAAGGIVIMGCRSGKKAETMLEKVRASSVTNGSSEKGVHLLPLDLASPKSIRECVAQFELLRPKLPEGKPLSALVLNAGIIGMPFGAYNPDMEPQLQVNLLGHALLHDLLRPALQATPGARVVVVASGSHYWITGPPDLNLDQELPPKKENFNYGHAYGFSNLCRILWTRALAKKVPYPVVSLHPACSPGTDAGRNMGPLVLISILSRALYYEWRGLLESQSIAKGARTQTFLAVAPLDVVKPLSGKFLSGNTCDGPLYSPVTPSVFAQRDDYADKVLSFVEAFVEKEREGGTN